jgi:hypothetical protein
LWENEFETKGEKITLILRKCLRTIKNTIRLIVVVIKMRIIWAGKLKIGLYS